MEEVLRIDHFLPHVGKTVRFRGTPFAFPIERVEGDGGPPPAGFPRSPFTVIFRGPPKTDVMPAGLYECEIENGPTYSLHVMPIHTPQPDRQEYQAAFN
jgi:hypothetical protein